MADIYLSFAMILFGIKAKVKAYNMVQTFSVQQGMTEHKQPWEEFSPRNYL